MKNVTNKSRICWVRFTLASGGVELLNNYSLKHQVKIQTYPEQPEIYWSLQDPVQSKSEMKSATKLMAASVWCSNCQTVIKNWELANIDITDRQ